ncbi:MAG: hypothetical protein HOP29_09145 [Phycisphaerales bacterium]|nr:hypothetical protein [Phycisphaerales bacterium]
MNRRVMGVGVVLMGFAGCGLLEQLGISLFPDGTEEAKLVAFNSEREFLDYFAGRVRDESTRGDDIINDDIIDDIVTGVPGIDDSNGNDETGSGLGGDGAPEDAIELTDGAAPPAPDAGGSRDGDDSFSETTTQEIGVDEADVVKTDGEYLYLISDEKLRIVQLDPLNAPQLVGEVTLTGYGRDIYLRDGQIVTLTATFGEFIAVDAPAIDIGVVDDGAVRGDDDVDESGEGPIGDEDDTSDEQFFAPVFQRPETIVTMIDATDRANPRKLSETRFDGSQTSSRMIDGRLYLVVSNYQAYYFDAFPALVRPGFAVPELTNEQVLPQYRRVDADGTETSGDILGWEDLYRPANPDGFGISSVISLDTENDAAFTAKGIVAEPGLIYSSTAALYLTNTDYDFTGQMRESTDVYKFEYRDGSAEPVAAGSVPGRVLNQYSMGEHNGYLRVATTVGPTFSEFGQVSESTNNVYVMGQEQDLLSVVGRLEGVAPRESIQSARFMGDRGFLVTFEQIDPLFTLDLADPVNPRIVGELKVPGFSTFLLPVDQDHILAVGQYIPPPGDFGNWGVQLSLFDVSDFAAPVQMDNVVIGQETGAYSEALYDPKAFTYFAETGMVAMPISIYPDYSQFEDVLPPEPETRPDGDVDDVGGGSDGSMGGGSVDAGDGVVTDDGTSSGGETPADGGETMPPVEGEAPPESETVVDSQQPSQMFEGLMVFSLSLTDGLSEMGRISTQFGEYPYSSYTRGVFIGSRVFAVTDNGVRGADVSDLSTVRYELALPRPDVDYGEVIPLDDFVVSDPGIAE